ncbi:response regulator [Flavobacterium frigoris]|uniref:Dolichyl phosphate glucosyltransferase n=1 Tax=Flavobacterium frigoris (strain PS1) TaxID=1086011 RepID=H7FP90_FLAFP|nr:response regulator [Flavobacterium frigoris]EIA09570.1 dolichyl phosphate glucosyltransferase [Flavobacterium frigoris PS1]
MKILIVDDQELVLLSLEKYLSDLGYEVSCANNMSDAITLYDELQPSLVISDINMPVLPNSKDTFRSLDYIKEMSGLEIVKYIKVIKKHSVPVMLLSGNYDDSVILKGFALGADDYMKKPLSLDEIANRIAKLIGVHDKKEKGNDDSYRLIQKKCIGVVIPFYDLKQEFFKRDYAKIIHTNLGYHFCFINLGDSNNLEDLEELMVGNEERISLYNCGDSIQLSEAVRLGALHLAKNKQFDFIGFINPDLEVAFKDFDDMVKTISNSSLKFVSCARPTALAIKNGIDILITKGIDFLIRKTLKIELHDALCGAKIMSKEVIEKTFIEKFMTNETFDLEILMRMKKIYGVDKLGDIVYEQPLKRWMSCNNSKVSAVTAIRNFVQIGQIALHYK